MSEETSEETSSDNVKRARHCLNEDMDNEDCLNEKIFLDVHAICMKKGHGCVAFYG